MPEVWMGNVEQWMDERFIMGALSRQGFQCRIVKKIFDKKRGMMADYCFIDFPTAADAERVVQVLNGNQMDTGYPDRRFLWKLNWGAHTGLKEKNPEYVSFVGDLTPDVNDLMLKDFFSMRYPSVKTAHVQKDDGGNNKGFGFVRFYDQREQIRSIEEQQGALGLGGKPLRVDHATEKGDGRYIQGGQQAPGVAPGGTAPMAQSNVQPDVIGQAGFSQAGFTVPAATQVWVPSDAYALQLASIVQGGRDAAIPKCVLPDAACKPSWEHHNLSYMANHDMDLRELDEATCRAMYPIITAENH